MFAAHIRKKDKPGEAWLREQWGPAVPARVVEYLRRNHFFFNGTDGAEYTPSTAQHCEIDSERKLADVFDQIRQGAVAVVAIGERHPPPSRLHAPRRGAVHAAPPAARAAGAVPQPPVLDDELAPWT
eukprot:gene45391-19893_t